MVPDPARLDRILSALPADDAAYLSSLVEPPWKQRARRLAARDDAIRAALALLAGDQNPPARLEELLARQAGTMWGHTGDHLQVAAAARILELNDGAPLRARQLRNIGQGNRAPVQ